MINSFCHLEHKLNCLHAVITWFNLWICWVFSSSLIYSVSLCVCVCPVWCSAPVTAVSYESVMSRLVKDDRKSKDLMNDSSVISLSSMKSQIDKWPQLEWKVINPPGICHQDRGEVLKSGNKHCTGHRSITDDDTFLVRFGEDRHGENSHHFTDTTN